MIANVVAVNPRKGFVAVRAAGGITVFELLGDYEVVVGDAIRGDFEALAEETYYNLTSDEAIDVFVQGRCCVPRNAWRMMA
jgi:hypothetical protein